MRVDDDQVRDRAFGTGGFFPPSELDRAMALDLLEARATVAELEEERAELEEERADLLEAAQPWDDFAMGNTCVLCERPFLSDRGEWRGKPCPLNHDDAVLRRQLEERHGAAH
jgi:hypothetical protein